MWKYTLAVTVIAVLEITAAQPTIGSCTPAQLNSFIQQLPNGSQCLAAIGSILIPGNASEDALNAFCTPDCGQAYAEFVAQNCSDAGAALSSVLFCLPSDVPSGPTHCLTQLFSILQNRTLDNLAGSSGCSQYSRDTRTCPANCSTFLQKFSDSVGCCYQGLYNDTGLYNDRTILSFLTRANYFSNDRAAIVRAVADPFLWNDCGVSLKTSFCKGNPYPGQRTVISGICPLQQLANFVSSLNSDCSKILLNPPPPGTLRPPGVYDKICTKDCAGNIAVFQNQTCLAPFDASLNEFACYKTEGGIGTRCAYSVVDMALRNASFILNANASCQGGAFNVCPSGCKDALTEVSKQLGCCYQTLQNNTKYLDTSVIKNLMSLDERVVFNLLGELNIWNACDVPLVKGCTGDPYEVAAAASNIFSSVILVFISAVLSFLA